MRAAAADVRARLQVKRRNYFLCSLLLLAGLGVHTLWAGEPDPLMDWMLLGWSVGFAVMGAWVGTGQLTPTQSALIVGAMCIAMLTVVIHREGGMGSPLFPLLHGMPLLVALFSPDTRVPTLASIAATLVALLVLGRLSEAPPEMMALQGVSFLFMGAAALVGAQTYARMRAAEKVAQQERLKALEQLAESERERRHREQERAEVERLVLVGQLAAGVAHEVNNPLAFVKSNLGFLEQELERELAPGREELFDVLAETQQGVLRIQQIVADLRRFSREGGGSQEPGRPEEAMQEALRLASLRLHSLGGVSLGVEEGLPEVRLGQRQLVQVLVNLLVNAADAVESVVPARRACIVVKAWQVDGAVRVAVEDNGPGLPEEVRARLFTPFFTTKPPGKGTGLGLALCREHVCQAGGTLVAENRAEGGARFLLTLPLASGAAVTGAAGSHSEGP
jgi:C4-dicarboxylate-specific signal transduction histidine kinase